MTIAYLKKRMDGRFKTQERRTNRRFAAVDKRFDLVDERFDLIDTRFDRLSTKMDARFDSMSEKLSAILRVLDNKYEHHGHIFDEHERRIEDLERPTGT